MNNYQKKILNLARDAAKDYGIDSHQWEAFLLGFWAGYAPEDEPPMPFPEMEETE